MGRQDCRTPQRHVCPIWDVATEELFLVRDRMGVKPLFYYPTADGVLFGSEPKAILAHPWVRPRVNKDGLREILVLAKNPEVTVYAGMHEVRPGQVVRVNRNGITKRRYWALTTREHWVAFFFLLLAGCPYSATRRTPKPSPCSRRSIVPAPS